MSQNKAVMNNTFEVDKSHHGQSDVPKGSMTESSNNKMVKAIHQQDIVIVDGHSVVHPSNNSNEIALQDIAGAGPESHQVPCACVENGSGCHCGQISTNSQVQFQSWNRWKAIALFIVTVLICIWLVVYITLSHTKNI